jgi:hypothetical protein
MKPEPEDVKIVAPVPFSSQSEVTPVPGARVGFSSAERVPKTVSPTAEVTVTAGATP